MQSAYLSNNKEAVTQAPDASIMTPETTAKTALASPTSNNTVPQSESIVNNKEVKQLLEQNGLQLPTPLKLSNSDITIPQNAQSVNNNYMQGSGNNSQGAAIDHTENINNSLQTVVDSDIINNNNDINGVEDNDKNVSRRIDGENWESRTQAVDTRTESQVESERRQTETTFQGRTAQTTEGSRRRYVLKLNEGTEKETSIDYTTKEADNSEAYRAVEILKTKGYDADYCDGSINITDNKGIVSKHNNAITLQNGKTLVSSNCVGSAEQTADHEEIHILQRTNNQAFVEYETVICENIIFDSEAYMVVVKEINAEHHFVDESLIETNEELEEELLTLNVMQKTLNEIIAYLRQCYNYDADLAKQKYGDIFKNWSEVAVAIDTLNSTVGRNILSDNDTDYELSDNDQYAKDKSFWTAENKNDTTTNETNGGVVSFDGVDTDKIINLQKISIGMSEKERYEILKDKKILLADVNTEDYEKAINNYPDLLNKRLKKSQATKLLKKVGEEFEVYGNYKNEDIELDFEFGKNNLDESVTKQKSNYDSFTKMLSCFSDVINNAVGIEAHNRNNEGYKEDVTLKQMYVLCSAFLDGDTIIPVKMEIKEFIDKPNRLYVAVALEGIKKDRVVSMGVPNNRSHVRTSPVTISISEILKNVNLNDKDFVKYIPKQFFENSDTDYELSDNDQYAKDKSFWTAENKNDTTTNETNGGVVLFSEPDRKEIYRVPTADENTEAMLGRGKNAVQRHINDIARKLDSSLRIVWADKNSDKLNGKNGKYIREINTIYLAKDMSVAEMYFEVFKHEFVHRLESKAAYKSFKDYLINKSRAFEEYARSSLKQVGENALKKYNQGKITPDNVEAYLKEVNDKIELAKNGSREDVIKSLTDHYYNTFINDNTLGKPIRDRFTLEDAEREIVADFAGEILFKGNKNRKDIAQALVDEDLLSVGDIETSVAALEELAKTDRNLFQKLWDIIKDFIASLKTVAQNKCLSADLEYIEQRLARVYDSRDTKKATKQSGGVQYSLKNYSEHQIENWKNSKRIVVYQNEAQFYEFVENSKKDKSYVKKLYFGAIPTEYADFIKQKTGVDVENYNCTLESEKIRKIFNDHGNIDKEKLRGQKAVTIGDILNIPKVLLKPDDIILSNDLYEGKPVINFIKIYGNEKTIVTAVVSDKHLDLFVQTMYINKKGSITTPTDVQASVNTPKATRGTASTNNRISQNNSDVNNNSMSKSENYSEDGQFSVGSPLQEARGKLNTYSGENLKDAPKNLKPQSNREWSAFSRSFANQTNGLQDGERKSIIIYTAEAQYVVAADGYMSGTIVVKNNIDEHKEMEAFVNDYTNSKVFSGSNDRYGNRQRNYRNDSNQLENGDTDSFYVELDSFIKEHTEQFGNIRQGNTDYRRKQEIINKRNSNEYGQYSVVTPMQRARESLKKEEKDRLWKGLQIQCPFIFLSICSNHYIYYNSSAKPTP